MTNEEILDEVLKYMVKNEVNGIFYGTPRDIMEELGVSSGPLQFPLCSWHCSRR
jgi:hypothetical protein